MEPVVQKPEGAATEPGAGQPTPAPLGSRFTYTSGSQPLAGYTIKRGIGHGGFGEVYYAVSDAGKEVALKLIRRNLEVELRGIRHCLNLKHPNLLSVFDIRQDERGDNWVVMEYITGECLQDAIAESPHGMPPTQAVAWFAGIAAGVACLHDHGIVHRDLKPANIFSDEGIVKVGDYGLSKFISCSRRSGQTESVGTVHYMAPEIANGRYGKEIDIYALGILLYEMLTGRVPFEGESVGEVLMKHLTTPADVSTLAEPYRSVVARALEKDPSKRFASVGEMLSKLPSGARPGAAGNVDYVDRSGPKFDVRVERTATGPAGEPHAATATPVLATVVEDAEEEPIARAVRRTWRRVRTRWDAAGPGSSSDKTWLLIALVVLIITVQFWLLPALGLLMFYGFYRLVRAAVMSPAVLRAAWRTVLLVALAVIGLAFYAQLHSPHSYPPMRLGILALLALGALVMIRSLMALGRMREPSEGSSPVAATLASTASRESAAEPILLETPRQRLAELFGSMLGSTLVLAAALLAMVLVGSFRGAPITPPQCAWLLLVGVIGAWAALIASKGWEGRRGDGTLRRFVMMLIGLAVGLAAWALAEYLDVDLPHDAMVAGSRSSQLPASFYAGSQPLLMAYLACFGTLFLLMRWWLQADPLRNSRLSLLSAAVSMAIAWLVAAVWSFPQPWMAMLAGAMSVSIQLGSPWVSPKQRRLRRAARG